MEAALHGPCYSPTKESVAKKTKRELAQGAWLQTLRPMLHTNKRKFSCRLILIFGFWILRGTVRLYEEKDPVKENQ